METTVLMHILPSRALLLHHCILAHPLHGDSSVEADPSTRNRLYAIASCTITWVMTAVFDTRSPLMPYTATPVHEAGNILLLHPDPCPNC